MKKSLFYLPKLPKCNMEALGNKYNLSLYRKIPSKNVGFLKKHISYAKPCTYRCRNTL